MDYIVYERQEQDTVPVARVSGKKVTGVKARLAEDLLKAGGWPKINPAEALSGSRIWAQKEFPDAPED